MGKKNPTTQQNLALSLITAFKIHKWIALKKFHGTATDSKHQNTTSLNKTKQKYPELIRASLIQTQQLLILFLSSCKKLSTC